MRRLFKNGKQILAFMLAFAVLSVSLFTGAVLSVSASDGTIYWDGTTTKEPTETDGAGNIIIDEAAELAWLVQVDSGAAKTGSYKIADGIKNIVLQPDTLADVKDLTSASAVNDFFTTNAAAAAKWTPIEAAYFTGTIDFNGATVYGMYCNTSGAFAGLFGSVDTGAAIKNLTIKNSYINDNTRAGFIFATTMANGAGAQSNGAIAVENCLVTNCYMNTSSGQYNVGFATGLNRNDQITIKNCAFYGNTMVNTGSEILYLNGKTEGSGKHFYENVLVLGLDTAFYHADTTITNVYSDVSATSSTNSTTVIDPAGLVGVDAMSAMPGLDWGTNWFAIENALPVVVKPEGWTQPKGPDTLYWNGDFTAPEDSDSDGIYEIDAASDIAYLASKTESEAYDSKGKTYKVIDGIKAIVMQPKSLAEIKDKTSAAEVKAFFDENAASAKVWQVIGYKGNYPFQGTFDGNGATIYGLYNDWASYSDWHKDLYGGLFGLVDNGAVIKNVAVKNSHFTTVSGFIGPIFANSAQDDWNAIEANKGTGNVTLENCISANNYIRITSGGHKGNVGTLFGSSVQDYAQVNNCLVYGNDAMNTGFTKPDATVGMALPLCNLKNEADKNDITNVIALGTTPYHQYDFGWAIYVQDTGGTGSVFNNVYTDQAIGNFIMYGGTTEYTSFEAANMGGLVSITADSLKGENAEAAMPALDWVNTWFAAADMPVFRAWHNFTVADNGDGTHSETCDRCGIAGEAVEHVFVDGEIISEPGCLTEGSQAQACACGAEGEAKTLPATGHTFGDVVEAVAPTCETDGTKEHKICSVCENAFAADAAADSDEYINIVDPATNHNIVEVDAKAVTCEENGHNAYEYCTKCDYTTIEVITAPGHEIVNVDAKAPTCEEAGYAAYEYCANCDYTTYEEIQANGHNIENVEAKAPTCEEAGYAAYEYCTECDYTTYEEIEALGHDLEDVAEVPVTDCAVDGMRAHQECNNGCGKYFVDGEEVEKSTLVIPAEHDLVDVAYVAETCTTDGIKAHQACSRCNRTFIDGEEADVVIPAAHKLVQADAKAATCTEDGWDAYEYCTACDYSTKDVIPAAHKLVQADAKAATCTEAGWAAYEYCENCDYTTKEEIAALGHTNAEAVKENEVAATCTAEGSYESVVYCSVCEEEISRETVTVDALGHDTVQVDAKAPTTTEIGWNAYEYCTRCDYTTYEELAKLQQTGWVKDGNVWYYYNEDGAMVTADWAKVSGKWYYFDANGAMQTGWEKVGGVWYYFDANGAMQTGWEKVKGVWYYFDANGAMQTGWEKVGGVWYYFDANGAMQTGWEKVGGVWYYFDANGAMQTGWEKVGGTWYYFNASGAMQTGWEKIGGTWYYFNTSGAMLANTSKNIGGKVYNFNASGACTNP